MVNRTNTYKLLVEKQRRHVHPTVVKYLKHRTVPTDNRERSKREEETQRMKLQLAAIHCRWLSVIISAVICTNIADPLKRHIDGSPARILSNDFTFTPWLSTLATF